MSAMKTSTSVTAVNSTGAGISTVHDTSRKDQRSWRTRQEREEDVQDYDVLCPRRCPAFHFQFREQFLRACSSTFGTIIHGLWYVASLHQIGFQAEMLLQSNPRVWRQVKLILQVSSHFSPLLNDCDRPPNTFQTVFLSPSQLAPSPNLPTHRQHRVHLATTFGKSSTRFSTDSSDLDGRQRKLQLPYDEGHSG